LCARTAAKAVASEILAYYGHSALGPCRWE
jgi:hypothetical protein